MNKVLFIQSVLCCGRGGTDSSAAEKGGQPRRHFFIGIIYRMSKLMRYLFIMNEHPYGYFGQISIFY